MTIRSIDMQVLVQKVGEVAKIQQAEKTSQHIKQQSFLEQIAQQTEVVSKTVNEASASESGLIRENSPKRKRNIPVRKRPGRMSLMMRRLLIGLLIPIRVPIWMCEHKTGCENAYDWITYNKCPGIGDDFSNRHSTQEVSGKLSTGIGTYPSGEPGSENKFRKSFEPGRSII